MSAEYKMVKWKLIIASTFRRARFGECNISIFFYDEFPEPPGGKVGVPILFHSM